MNMHSCPHCGKQGFTALRRAFLGPGVPAACSQCGQKAGVPGWSMAMLLPMVAGLVSALVLPVPSSLAVWLAAAGVALTALLWETCVPLTRR